MLKSASLDTGRGGLGVFVLAGLVRPPSLVSSAVDAMLALLCVDARERARDGWQVLLTDGDLGLGLVRRACVRRDSVWDVGSDGSLK